MSRAATRIWFGPLGGEERQVVAVAAAPSLELALDAELVHDALGFTALELGVSTADVSLVQRAQSARSSIAGRQISTAILAAVPTAVVAQLRVGFLGDVLLAAPYARIEHCGVRQHVACVVVEVVEIPIGVVIVVPLVLVVDTVGACALTVVGEPPRQQVGVGGREAFQPRVLLFTGSDRASLERVEQVELDGRGTVIRQGHVSFSSL